MLKRTSKEGGLALYLVLLGFSFGYFLSASFLPYEPTVKNSRQFIRRTPLTGFVFSYSYCQTKVLPYINIDHLRKISFDYISQKMPYKKLTILVFCSIIEVKF